MNNRTRSMLYLTRNFGKTFLLFGLLFLLGNLMIGAVLVRDTVRVTDEGLMGNIPPLAVLESDRAAYTVAWEQGEPPENRFLRKEIVHAVGDLPYVKSYNFYIDWVSIYSRYLYRSHDLFFLDRELEEEVRDLTSLRIWSPHLEMEQFPFRGIHFSEEMIEIISGLISISEGRRFSQEELASGAPVTMVSRQVADENRLEIGSVLNMENNVFRGGVPSETNLLASRELDLKVIGIFEVNPEMIENEDLALVHLNRMFIPFALAEEIEFFKFQVNQEYDPWFYGAEFRLLFNPVYLLHDVRDLRDFISAAEPYLPELWRAQGLVGYVFGHLDSSMENLLWLADSVFYVTIGATILIVSLLIILFLLDRKAEMGIYLALGEKKSRIVGQILLEVLVTASLAFSFAIFTGNLFSDGLSSMLLEQELVRQEQELATGGFSLSHFIPLDLLVYSPPRMSHEEMLEAFEVSLSLDSLLFFYGVGLGTVLVATVIPIRYVLRLDPKKILM